VVHEKKFMFADMCCTGHLSQGRGCIVITTWISNPGISGLEGFLMRNIRRYVGSLVFTAVLAAPAVALAGAAPQEAGVQIRVYDRDHRDYHNWDNREDRAYRNYLAEQRREYRDYNKQNHKEQKHYWNWRHSHPDHDEHEQR
jgi:hypothetical protein